MWPFVSRKYRTLSHAVLAGDLRAARRMLAQGADPNQFDADDTAGPIHYALQHGPAMVQLLIDHGADVNVPARGSMPLAVAEATGNKEVAAILRRAGARVRAPDEELALDPRLRLRVESKIRELVFTVRMLFPTESPEFLADCVEGKLNLEFSKLMPFEEQERIWKDVRALIRKECGVKDYLVSEKQVPRTWENLPSMVMAAVPRVFSYERLARSIVDEAPDMQLVCLLPSGFSESQDNAARRIHLLYEFADDPLLVLMRIVARVPAQEQIIVRASFMRETVSQVAASNLGDLAARLSQLAKEKGRHTTTAE